MSVHLPKDLYDKLDLNEELVYSLENDDDGRIYQNLRNRTYTMNAWLRPKKFSISLKKIKGSVVLKRIK